MRWRCCFLSVRDRLREEFEKHEEWMQGNVKHGYDAREFQREPFPPFVIIKRSLRLPEGKDILTQDEMAAIDYAHYLRTVHCLEVSNNDEFRVKQLVLDFKFRGKLNCLSKDADIMDTIQGNGKMDRCQRDEWFRILKAAMNYNHSNRVVIYNGVDRLFYLSRVEVTDGRKIYFKKTTLKREILDIRRPDGTKVFSGVMECGEDKPDSIACVYFNDDSNDHFVSSCINGRIAHFLHHYLPTVKGYSDRCVSSIFQGFNERLRFSAQDSVMDKETYAVRTLSSVTGSNLSSKMSEMRMDILLPDILKQAQTARSDRKSRPGFSDAAMERVEASYRLREKPGLNVAAAGDASVLTDSSHHTDGNASNRSVVTADIQMRMPELRLDLNRLKSVLHNLSPEDPLFADSVMKATDFDELSLNSSASAALAAFYKDTKKCITLLKIRICELEHGRPLPSNGSAEPSPSSEGGRASAQGG